ncbi:MCIN protein, partial [Turnix velox]|nr:MCIN protein [Turnix velox]
RGGSSMEQGGRRRAFGSICPNRVQGPPVRPVKKPTRSGEAVAETTSRAPSARAAPLLRLHRSGVPPAPAAPALGESARSPAEPSIPSPVTLPYTPSTSCFQDEPEFDFQEFRDAVNDFVSASTSMQPPLDCTDFNFSLGEEVALVPHAVQLESSAVVPQELPQRPPTPKLCWRDLVDQHQKALGDAQEANSQLQETLKHKQDELATLSENTVHLKELAIHARQLATVLETLVLPQHADGAALPPPLPLAAAAASAGPWDGVGLPEWREQAAGVNAMLRDMSEKCSAALRSLGGCSPRGDNPGEDSPGRDSPTAKRLRAAPGLHGAFHGLRTERVSGEGLEGVGSLRVALGESGSIRTLAFPQGNAFSLRTAGGGYQFRWVPR